MIRLLDSKNNQKEKKGNKKRKVKSPRCDIGAYAPRRVSVKWKRQFHQRRAELESVPLLDCSTVVSQEVGLVGRSVCALSSTSPERTHSLAASPTVRWAPSLPLSSSPSLSILPSLSLSSPAFDGSPTRRSQPSAGLFFSPHRPPEVVFISQP